jgi:hypothetical protein
VNIARGVTATPFAMKLEKLHSKTSASPYPIKKVLVESFFACFMRLSGIKRKPAFDKPPHSPPNHLHAGAVKAIYGTFTMIDQGFLAAQSSLGVLTISWNKFVAGGKTIWRCRLEYFA